MWQKIINKFNRYHYKRYLLVMILFILAFIFGKNMDILSPQQQQLKDQADAQKKIIFGIYDVPADQNQSEIKNLFSVKKGQCGRIFFNLKNLYSSDSSFSGNPKIKVLLSNDFDQEQYLGLYELKNDRFVQNVEVDFCAEFEFKNLLFVKDENSRKSSFEISDLVFYPLSISKNNFSNLISTISGNSDFSKIIYNSGFDSKDANSAFKFTRSNQMVGQTFVANTDAFSGVDLKMRFVGGGGIGNYSLELREISFVDGKIKLSTDRIGFFYFDKSIADKDLKIEDGIYHIPLAAHIEVGKTYFIAVSNQAVNFNILNTLEIYCRSERDNSEKMISFIRGKASEVFGSLYFKVYGVNYQEVAGEKVLTGAKIFDNGDGFGLYTYEQKGNFSDYLDLEQFITEDNKNYDIFYDSVFSAVSAKAEGNNAFIYKINTLYPFTKMKIEAQQSGGEFRDSLIYFSFNNKDWQEINADLASDGTLFRDQNKFQKLIQGEGESKTIYIKVTYNKDATQGGNGQFFGLKNLKIVAELKLK